MGMPPPGPKNVGLEHIFDVHGNFINPPKSRTQEASEAADLYDYSPNKKVGKSEMTEDRQTGNITQKIYLMRPNGTFFVGHFVTEFDPRTLAVSKTYLK